MDELSGRQALILRFVRAYIADEGYAPSTRDIMEELRISSSSVVSYNLHKLAAKGYLAVTPHVARSLRVLAPVVVA